MDVFQEENPLQIEIESSSKVTIGMKNNVGRPTKNREILFSTQPKSIISILLREEKDKIIKEDHNKSNLLEEKTIELVKSWTCDYCLERTFYKKSDYKKHLLSHKVYKCDYSNCSYTTKFNSNLKIHKRTHTSVYQYVCDECTFRSKFINSLKAHKRLHNRERPFGCQHCEYRCNSKSNLKKHCSRKHST